MFRLDETEVEVISNELIEALINNHNTDRELKNQNYYEGKHKILEREFQDKSKPNYKIVNNFCKYVTDSNVGYFMGKPVAYSSKKTDYMTQLQDIFDANDEQKVNMEIAQEASIYGYACEIIYTKENDKGEKEIRFKPLPLSENKIILVFDTTVEENLIMAVRYWDSESILTGDKVTHAFIHTKTETHHYVKGEDGFELTEEPEQHGAGEVNINFYFNRGKKLEGDFECVMSLNDSYNNLISDDINESEFSVDAILKVWGIEDLEMAERMKEVRLINFGDNVPNDTKADAEWLIKEINAVWKENTKNRVMEDIHKLSGVPNMSDKNFAESSGIAIERRMKPMEDIRGIKERYFKEGLQRRIRIISNLMKINNDITGEYDYRDIDMKFQKNMPTDYSVLINVIITLFAAGLMSKQTSMSVNPFIEDPAYEMELIDKEKEEIELELEDEEDEPEQDKEETTPINTDDGEVDQEQGKGDNKALPKGSE